MISRRKILVIGGGWVGRRHLDAFRAVGGIDLAVCEVAVNRRKDFFGNLAADRVFACVEDALENKWDAAVIATPAHTHIAIGTTLADRGIPTLVEKPLAVALDGIDAWLESVRAHRVPVMVGYIFRCHPLLAAARAAIFSGSIGRPVQLVAARGGHLPTRRPEYANTYYANRAEGGGVIHDILSHVFNAAEWIVGPLDRLSADAVHACVPGVEVEDTVQVIARHGAVLASYSVNQHQPMAEFSLTINGDAGSVRIAFHEHRWQIAHQPDGGWTSYEIPRLAPTEWFVMQARAFLDVIDRAAEPPCSLAAGITTLHAILAATAAVEHLAPQWVEVDYHVQ